MDKRELIEKYKDTKELKELYDDLNKVRNYLKSDDKSGAENLISELMSKHMIEIIVYNATHPIPPRTIDENLANAETFLTDLILGKICKSTTSEEK